MTNYFNISKLEGISSSVYDKIFFEKTLKNRMNITNVRTLEDYSTYLKSNDSELSILVKALNNTYSEFFRNRLAFESLERTVLPEIIRRKRVANQKEIRIWSAACAAGQEAYSIAILCNEFSKVGVNDLRFRIFATDISEPEIEKAQLGIYNEIALNNVTLKRIKENFHNNGDFYTVKDEIKKYVDFSTFDLFDEYRFSPASSIYGDFDIVLCNNLLFYYDAAYMKMIIEKLNNNLVEGGYLIVSEAEVRIIKNNINYIYNAKNAVFIKP